MQLRIDGDAGVEVRLGVAADARTGRAHPGIPTDQGDPPVAKIDQVPHRGVGGRFIVHRHQVDAVPGNGAVDEHEREPAPDEVIEISVTRSVGSQDDAVNPPPAKQPQVCLLPLWIVMAVAEDHGIAALLRDLLDAEQDVCEERVDVGNDEADRERPTGLERAGDDVRLERELLGGGKDPLAEIP